MDKYRYFIVMFFFVLYMQFFFDDVNFYIQIYVCDQAQKVHIFVIDCMHIHSISERKKKKEEEEIEKGQGQIGQSFDIVSIEQKGLT